MKKLLLATVLLLSITCCKKIEDKPILTKIVVTYYNGQKETLNLYNSKNGVYLREGDLMARDGSATVISSGVRNYKVIETTYGDR